MVVLGGDRVVVVLGRRGVVIVLGIIEPLSSNHVRAVVASPLPGDVDLCCRRPVVVLCHSDDPRRSRRHGTWGCVIIEMGGEGLWYSPRLVLVFGDGRSSPVVVRVGGHGRHLNWSAYMSVKCNGVLL